MKWPDYDERAAKLRVGQRVSTTHPRLPENPHAVAARRVIAKVARGDFGSGFGVLFKPRKPCKCCGRPFDDVDHWIDAAWVLPPFTAARSRKRRSP